MQKVCVKLTECEEDVYRIQTALLQNLLINCSDNKKCKTTIACNKKQGEKYREKMFQSLKPVQAHSTYMHIYDHGSIPGQIKGK